MKNEGPERGPARPSGAGDNYCSRVSKQRSVPWRHQIISLIRGTVIIIQSNKALGALGPARATVLVASMLLGLYRPRLMRSTRGYLMKRLLDPGQNALAPPSLASQVSPPFHSSPFFFSYLFLHRPDIHLLNALNAKASEALERGCESGS